MEQNARRRWREREPHGTHLMQEIESLRSTHGVRVTAAVALVAERHGMPEDDLSVEHFRWLLGDNTPSRPMKVQ